MNTFFRPRNRGFTLVELLMVMGIISILTSLIFASASKVRSKGRDAERRASLVQLRLALDLYKDRNGVYPSTGGNWYSSETGDYFSNNGGNWIPSLAPAYFGQLPKDPLGGSSTISNCVGPYRRAFLYRSDGTHYALISHCAMENPWSNNDPLYDSIRPTWGLKVCSVGLGCTW